MYFPFSHINPARIAITYVTLSTWLIMGAFFLQIFMDIRPCELCLWQRIPHYIVMFGAVLVPLRFLRLTFITQAIGYFANVLLSAYHSGIERKWWAGLEGCSSADMKNLSLTNYNFIICLVLGISVLYFIGGYGEQSKSIR
jgi:disulfide bond formation protein DsbB